MSNFWPVHDMKVEKTIWKVHLNVVDGWQGTTLPGYKGVAFVGSQDGELHLWVHVDASKPEETVNYKVTGTGHPAPNDGKYVGSAIMPPFVWHVWEFEDLKYV